MRPLLVLLLLPLASLGQTPPAPAPDLSISANNGTSVTLYQGWPLLVDVSIMNSLRLQGGSAPSLLISPQSGTWTDTIQLTATGSSGNVVTWTFNLVGAPDSPSLTLTPSSYAIATWQLAPSVTAAIPPDTYQLVATMQVNSTTGWNGTVSTSPVTIQIAPEPALVQDQQLTKALIMSQYQANAGNLDAALSTIQQYLTSYPNDPLALTASANLLQLQGYPQLAYAQATLAMNAYAQTGFYGPEAPTNLLTTYQQLLTYMTTPPASMQPTSVNASNIQVNYSSADQTVALSASVNSSTNSVNEGTVTFTVTGVGNAVTATVLQGNVTVNYTIPGGTASGSYPLLDSYNGTANFQPSSDTVQLIIAATPITITANNSNRVYGQPNAAFTTSYAGFMTGDTGSSLQGMPLCTTTATQSSPVGTYPINCTGVTSSNYTITFVPGTLTITPAQLTLTANSVSRAFGAANPALNSVTPSSFVNGDTLASLSGTLLCTTSATINSPVGVYPITCSGLTSPNYTISFVPGTLTIGKVASIISWSTPADITNGTALSSAQLNAMANVPGTFTYTPPAGTKLTIGQAQTLSVSFTPSDTTDYSSAMASVLINVDPLPGDVNGDGVVNCTDIAIVKAAFGTKVGQPGYNLNADVNHDGVVNVLDLSFVARHLPTGTTCP
jgi:MBG domain (YGX type)/Dockerin type I domain/Bacterial Ig-like domain (group 3)